MERAGTPLRRAAKSKASRNGQPDRQRLIVTQHSGEARPTSRLVESAHHHHDIAVATMHVHLDDDSCLEVTALKGRRDEISHFADHVIAERGVRYGRTVIIPASRTKPARKATSRKTQHRH